ncbi:hypothetical protein Dxin01_03376 [Deinococcus xinjiangensis]|uniref:Uncharacterized protein n=1 Tax=Deinococcus xinjiangensis TaxID=457454 RepID=A0ABP9VIT3_9DEIO
MIKSTRGDDVTEGRSGTLPSDNFTVCNALPLPGETQVYPVGDTYTTGLAPLSLGHTPSSVAGAVKVATFGSDPDALAAEKLLKQIILRNALSPR